MAQEALQKKHDDKQNNSRVYGCSGSTGDAQSEVKDVQDT